MQRLREHLTVLRAIIDERTVNVRGAVDLPVMPVALPGSTGLPVYVAAMGPARFGSPVNWPTARCRISPDRAPSRNSSPRRSPRPPPGGSATPAHHRDRAGGVTEDADTVRAAVADRLAFYDQIPSYQKVLAREGASRSAELAVIGTAQTVSRQLNTYVHAGATDVALMPLQTDPADLTPVWDLAAGL